MLSCVTTLREYAGKVRRHEITGQFVRYAMVGIVNVILFFAIFNVLTPAHPSRARTVLAYAGAFLVTSVFSFTLNKRWAFKDTRRERIAHQYALFLSLTLVGLALQTGVFALLLIPLHQYGRLGRNVAALPGIPISVLWNFTAYRRWTFNSATAAAIGPGSA
jgi:putative flippase GtrA